VQVLPDGRVMVAMTYSSPSQILNPATGAFLDGPQFPNVLTYPSASVLLLDGRMLVVGGNYNAGTTKSSVAFQ
jgi:hypothetical protein